MKPTLLVLAAGMGSRYGGLKQIDPVGPSGETILDYSVFDAKRAGFGKVVFVIRKDIEDDFKSVFADRLNKTIPVEWVFQELSNLPTGMQVPEGRTKPWGTGHAVMMAANAINEPFAVINADDFYGREAFEKAAGFLNQDLKDTDYAMVAYQLKNTLSDFGSVSRGICTADEEGWLQSVVENTKIAREGTDVYNTEPDGTKTWLSEDSLVSMNFWCFRPTFFGQLDAHFRNFIVANISNIKSEFYIPTPVDNLVKSNQARVKVLPNTGQWFGITYQEDRPEVVSKINQLVKSGEYPESLYR